MRRAIVMGGSFAGLNAAQALSQHVEEVVVLEPDDIGEDGLGERSPHRTQLHALLAMGHTQIESRFPGITQELVEAGARLGQGRDVQFYVDGVCRPPVDGIQMLGASRPFLEAAVRRRVLALGNVRLVHGHARGLTFDGERVSGARFSEAGSPHPEQMLDADLVVDAMGRSSRVATWLEEAGRGRVPTDRMRVDLGYATASFTRGDELGSTVIAHSAPGPASNYQPGLTEPGALAAVEGGRWSVVVAGYADQRPTDDVEDFLARMRRCVGPIRTVAQACSMIGKVETFNFRESQRRNYHGCSHLPGGLVVLGDALASVNPVYGQGLTLAALQAHCLDRYLGSGADLHEPATAYFRRASAFVDAAWQLSTTADLAQPHVLGPYPPGYRLMKWAGDKITGASVTDPEINDLFMNVVHMKVPPRQLTSPAVLLRALRVGGRRDA
ncbi:hypothetical protein [Streptomyces solicathayae]|uniref:FAD-binding domain-containing protein n=1 Tax=Streptomyces solicathayae TaxID=3081768 RepID=A0ABZ0LMA6_9ACTN|nr:hypothetical protein [Streptomyces sp. HUAS YS2]WOX19934.1 hypothetical protein R2D22_00355 [Streptomyces sp. HUAS YS2]